MRLVAPLMSSPGPNSSAYVTKS